MLREEVSDRQTRLAGTDDGDVNPAAAALLRAAHDVVPRDLRALQHVDPLPR